LILLGGFALAWTGTPTLQTLFGPLAIVGACISWGIDNNLTRNIASGDPVAIATTKSLVAGTANTALGLLVAHAAVPTVGFFAAAALVGFLGYGLSLVLFILALRELGTARTGAYFSTAPFIGTAIAVAMGSAVIDARFLIAAVCMIAGVWLHVTEQHQHEHTHEPFEHEHAHVHDEHHRHEHSPDDPTGEPHTHRHRHERLVHAHPHFPDIHHRHAH
ncbi:MAG TPA: EamA family transporter, partial [Candidatus Aquilonibacter sp.]